MMSITDRMHNMGAYALAAFDSALVRGHMTEEAQQTLVQALAAIYADGGKPVVLGNEPAMQQQPASQVALQAAPPTIPVAPDYASQTRQMLEEFRRMKQELMQSKAPTTQEAPNEAKQNPESSA